MSLPYASVLPPPPSIDRLSPELRETVARYRIALEDGRTLDAVLDHGKLSLEEVAGDADCLLECASDQLGHLLSGEADLLTAYMRGDVRIKKGNLELAKRLYRFLRVAREPGGHP
jgi:putative sterol carrier protein